MILHGVCHIHSRYSYDGAISLGDLRDLLVKKGASFALMTEHTDHLDPVAGQECIEACRQHSDDTFRFVPGFEVPYLGTHILVIGARDYYQGDSREILMRWQSQGAVLVVAHPHRNGYRIDQFLHDHVDGIEVWNSQYDGIHAPRYRATSLHRVLRRARAIHAYGSLDLHRSAHRHGPQLTIDARNGSEEGIVTALRTGAFSIVRGPVTIGADGSIGRGNAGAIRFLGIVMPTMIALLKLCSSLASRFGLRSFPIKKWIRSRV